MVIRSLLCSAKQFNHLQLPGILCHDSVCPNHLASGLITVLGRLLEALGSILEDRKVPLVSDFFFLALLVIYSFLFVLFPGEDTIREPVLLSLLGGEPRLLLHPLLDDIPLEA